MTAARADTLHRLIELGYNLGIISNTHWRWTQEMYDDVKSFFEVITLSYEHGFAKPHPSIFQSTAAKLNVNPENCLHVGDDPFTDIVGGKGAGADYAKNIEYLADEMIKIRRNKGIELPLFYLTKSSTLHQKYSNR